MDTYTYEWWLRSTVCLCTTRMYLHVGIIYRVMICIAWYLNLCKYVKQKTHFIEKFSEQQLGSSLLLSICLLIPQWKICGKLYLCHIALGKNLRIVNCSIFRSLFPSIPSIRFFPANKCLITMWHRLHLNSENHDGKCCLLSSEQMKQPAWKKQRTNILRIFKSERFNQSKISVVVQKILWKCFYHVR